MSLRTLSHIAAFWLPCALALAAPAPAAAQPAPAAAQPAPAAAQPAPAAAQDDSSATSTAAAPIASSPPAAADATPASETAPASTATQLQELRKEVDELKAERASQAANDDSEAERTLKIYGFLDFGLKKSFAAKDPLFAGLIQRKLTFVLGDINLYFDAQPLPSWRALVETRLTTYPHGEETVDASGKFNRVDTRVFDVNSPSGRNKVIWGGIVIERAQIEHTIVDAFNLRVGYFLTPYGIWNVDHGMPTLISLLLPSFQVEESMPGRQLGVQAYGFAWSNNWQFGYSAYVSNGRAPFLEDPSDNKAFGGRLTASVSGDSASLQLGASGYIGDSEQINKQLSISGGSVSLSQSYKYHYKEWAAGADASLDYGHLRVRSEGLVHRVRYDDGLHEPVDFGQPGTFRPNRYEYFGYAICAYRLGAIEPYTYTELKYTSPRDGQFDFTYIPSLGINAYLSTVSQLKVQYAAPKFYTLHGPSDHGAHNFRLIDMRYVISF